MATLRSDDLRTFSNALSPKPLTTDEPDNSRYVEALHQGEDNPIEDLALKIDWNANPAGAYLFTGMPGTGKTTELFRLRQRLRAQGHVAFYIDGLEYIQPATEVSIGDFLIGVILGFADALEKEHKVLLLEQGYAERFRNFMKSEIGFEPALEAGAEGFKTSLKINLRQSVAFKQDMQRKLELTIGTLLMHLRELVQEGVRTLSLPEGKKVVLLVDSLEKMHGSGAGTGPDPVLKSLSAMVSRHADDLFLSGLHIVYAVPPYLLKLTPYLGSRVDAVCHLTSGHIFQHRSRNPDPDGLNTFAEILNRRCARWPELLTRPQLNQLIIHSGGDLREYFRLVDRIVTMAATRPGATFPIQDELVIAAIRAQRRDYLPLADDVTTRLRHALAHFSPLCTTEADVDQMIRDLNLRRLLVYRNGEDWYLPHPLLWDALQDAPPAGV